MIGRIGPRISYRYPRRKESDVSAEWTYTQWIARLNHESQHATPSRLVKTLTEVEKFLEKMWGDPNWDDWVTTYYAYMAAMKRID